MSFASLNGARIIAGSISIPLYGLWSADVSLATDSLPSATPATVVLGNLTLVGAVYRSAAFAGSRTVRLVGGHGGWHQTITIGPYRKGGGINRATVLGDAAKACGETIEDAANPNIGQFMVTQTCPASRVLRQLAGDDWHVRPDGVTVIGSWPATTVRSSFQVINQSGGKGVCDIATEDYAAFLPGARFSSPLLSAPFTVGASVFRFAEDGTARVEVMTNAVG